MHMHNGQTGTSCTHMQRVWQKLVEQNPANKEAIYRLIAGSFQRNVIVAVPTSGCLCALWQTAGTDRSHLQVSNQGPPTHGQSKPISSEVNITQPMSSQTSHCLSQPPWQPFLFPEHSKQKGGPCACMFPLFHSAVWAVIWHVRTEGGVESTQSGRTGVGEMGDKQTACKTFCYLEWIVYCKGGVAPRVMCMPWLSPQGNALQI